MRKFFSGKLSKGLISLLLVLSVTASLFVPYTVHAEEIPATGNEIYAMAYKINPQNQSVWSNVEIVFQKGNTPDPSKELLTTFSNFADGQYDEDKNPPWITQYPTGSGNSYGSNAKYFVVKDKIQPTSIAGWFKDTWALEDIKGLENLDTSECRNMSSAFSSMSYMKSLDLSSFDTSKVENFEGCINSNALESLNVSGFKFDSCQSLVSFIRGNKLTSINLSGIDVSKCKTIKAFITNCAMLEELDCTSFNPKNVRELQNAFCTNASLKSIKFGEFQPGADNADNRLYFNKMFLDCPSLEELDCSTFELPANKERVEYESMFSGCTSLRTIKNIENIFIPDATADTWTHRRMFKNCSSLEEIDLSAVNLYIKGAEIFSGCSSLKSLNLGSMGLSETKFNKWYYQNSRTFSSMIDTGEPETNIYEGCDELSEFTFSPYYPPANQQGSDPSRTIGYGNSKPIDRKWIKIKMYDESKYPSMLPDGTSYVPQEALNTKLSTEELFCNFQPKYAGTWVAESKITLNANGGTPNQQAIKGARGMKLEYTASDITTPTRNGYKFKGWYADRESTESQKLEPGITAKSWSYYAHWEDNTYKIVLHNNETPEKTVTIENVKYAQFVPLSGKTFTSSDSGKILAGWNTRANGEGMEFAANESVDKLTAQDGGTVDLYAIWNKPDVIINFESHGGTEISPRYYTIKEEENVPYGNLSEPMKDGYTFMGWYTEAGGKGKKVVTNETDPNTETAYVSLSTTLHAYWQRKPDVTFNLQGGTIDGEPKYVKVCDYGHAIGTIPTPVNGNQAFMGWFTEKDGGTEITSATKATGNVTYYAHWGWQPRFETNGGSYKKYTDPDGTTHYANPDYPVQSSSSYNLGTLPVVERENYTFDGWYIGDTDTKIKDNDTVNLSENSVFKARWSLNPICTVTLNFDDGATPNKTIKVYKSRSGDDQNIIGELPTPTRAGYRFEGWYDNDGNKYTYKSRLDSDAPDTLTLTARWTAESHTVTFDPTDGEMVGSTTYTVADGKTLTYLPGANYIEKSGGATIIKKSFDGWYTERNGGGTKLTTETQITADATYYANWVDNRVLAESYNSMIRWGTLSGNDVTNLGDTLVFHPSASGNISAHLTVDFALENQNNQLPEGSVRITLPKKFFTGWDGTTDVTTTESTFNNFNVETSADGEYYILTNAKDFKSTVLEPVYTVDPMKVPGGYVDENGVCRDFFNKEFNIKIELKENGAEEYTVFQERTLKAELHTDVQTSIYKEQASATLSWSSGWGEKPSDADEYFYVVWTLNASNYNSNQPYQLKWSENTVHDGSVVYSNGLDTWSNEYNKDETHRVTVVTKHRRDEAMAQGTWAEVKNEAILNVKWKSGFEQQFRTTGIATAYVGVIIDGEIRTLKKTVPNEYNQDAHYVYGGQDLILNSDADNLAPFIYRLAYTEKKNNYNPTLSPAGEMSVKPRTYTLTDGLKDRGDIIISAEKPTGANTRSKWTDAYNQDKLDDGDYYFTYLDINVTEYDSVYLNGDWSNPYENDNLYDYGDIKVYYRTMGSNDFELLKTVTHDEMGISAESGTEFTNGYEARIILPGDTVGYKVEYTSSRYTTDIKVNTGLELKNSRKLHSLVSTHANAGKHTLLKNKSEMSIQCNGVNDIAYSTEHDAWLSAYELTLSESELYAAKSCLNETTINNPENYFVTDTVASTVEFPVAITGWAYSKNQLGYIKRVKSGIFHDLLPHGFMVDRSKIIVCGRTDEQAQKRGGTTINSQRSSANATSYSLKATEFPGQISSDYYSVTFKDNWEGSGQTMMIINVNCPEEMTATGFVVYYKCKTTINNLHINGTTPKNYVAFTDTTPEQSVPELRVNTKNYFDTATRPLFESVDNNQTAYTYSTTTLKTPNVYQYGADSNVATEGADIAKHQVVGLNTGYSYNISYEGDTSTQTHNLIVYDIIERHIGGSESQWMGEFKGVDVSSIKNQYSADEKDGKCDPVLYYSKTPKSEFTKDMFDLNKTEIWSTTPPEEMKDVTAIAVDCRKTDSGKDFVLGIKKGIEFTINMMSPDDEQRSEIETYNEAVVTGFNKEIGRNLVMNTLTSVTLRFTKPQFVKSAFPASGTQDKPESVVTGSVMDYILTVTNPDPELPMTNVVIEDKFPMGLVPNNYYKVKFNNGSNIPIDSTSRVSYSVTTGKNDNNEDVRVFTATVDILNPGDTVELTIPVKVELQKDENITNEAKITSINGVPYSNITSNKTYHTVTGVKAKILKVNAKDEPLEGATLQIYERNDTNCDEQGKLKPGAAPIVLENDGTTYGPSFTSSTEVSHFDVAAGDYILHESAVPENSGYKLAADIPFTIDVEGIIKVNGEPVNYVKMVDEPAYKVIFHENKPGGTADEIQKVFRIYEPMDLTDSKVTHFYDIPEWAGDEYVFAGWYHNDGYSECDTPDTAAGTASSFENDAYTERDTDYHLYAKWIKVGTVAKSDEDTNIISGYRGFGLAGVQIREPQMYDDNYTEITPGGLRFVTSLSEELLRNIDALSTTQVNTPEGKVDVEYGYAVGTEANINAFIDHYGVADTTAYTLQYKGENVNGKNTNQAKSGADTDYRYITNVNCTRGTGKIAKDHRNFTDYRLYTLVVTYEGDSASKKSEKLDARSYIRYYDANGKLRVFYNTYKKNTYYGGCMCSYNQVSSMALPNKKAETADNP